MNDGYYRGVVARWALSKSSKGTEQVVVDFDLPDDGNERLTWYGSFSDRAADITIRGLRAIGWTGDDLSDLSEIEGKSASLTVRNEEWEGKVTAKVKWVNPIDGPAIKEQLAPAEAKSFAARMRAKVKAIDAAEGKPKVNGKPPPKSSTRRAPEPPPHTDADSDLPF